MPDPSAGGPAASERSSGLISATLGAAAMALALLWLASDRWYTTAGFDFEGPRAGRIVVRYVRLRWDARCFWAGWAEQPRAPHAPPMDWWDPGGTFFDRSVPPRPRSPWNRLGWWLIRDVADDPYEPTRYSGAIASRWVGVPGWIPPALLACWPLGRWAGRLRPRRGRARAIKRSRPRCPGPGGRG